MFHNKPIGWYYKETANLVITTKLAVKAILPYCWEKWQEIYGKELGDKGLALIILTFLTLNSNIY